MNVIIDNVNNSIKLNNEEIIISKQFKLDKDIEKIEWFDNWGEIYYKGNKTEYTADEALIKQFIDLYYEATNNSWNTIREKRNCMLHRIDWLKQRHRDQKEINCKTSLTDNQYKELLVYIQELRDIPQKYDTKNIVWPTKPKFLKSESE